MLLLSGEVHIDSCVNELTIWLLCRRLFAICCRGFCSTGHSQCVGAPRNLHHCSHSWRCLELCSRQLCRQAHATCCGEDDSFIYSYVQVLGCEQINHMFRKKAVYIWLKSLLSKKSRFTMLCSLLSRISLSKFNRWLLQCWHLRRC